MMWRDGYIWSIRISILSTLILLCRRGEAYKLVLETPERAKEIHDEVDKAIFCQLYYKYGAKYYGDPILIKYNAVDEYFRSKIYFNTKERMEAYDQYDTLLSGDSYMLPKEKEKKAMCV